MALETDDFVALLRCHDVDPGTAGRIGGAARARFSRKPAIISRAYSQILEPALVVAAIVASLSWVLDRISFLIR
jgi:hypothetical protein